MKYIMIRTDDMLNGDGLRVVLFCSGCNHYCDSCHNPETWDVSNGNVLDQNAIDTLMEELNKDYISGITLSGGDPLHPSNIEDVFDLCSMIRKRFGNTKTIWLYTGSDFEDLLIKPETFSLLYLIDVVVDGEFEKGLADTNYHWAGSTNQRVIDVKKTLETGTVQLWQH